MRTKEGMARTTLGPRQVRIYQALCAGETPEVIAAREHISHDTFGRDLQTISERVLEWAAEQVGEALSFALATYKHVITEAWAAYHDAQQKLNDWLAGEYDRTTQVPDPVDGARLERKPPMLRLEIAEYLKVIVSSTKELTKLAGLEKVTVNVAGTLAATVTHQLESLDDAFNRLTDPEERAAFIARVRAADEASRYLEEAIRVSAVSGAAQPD